MNVNGGTGMAESHGSERVKIKKGEAEKQDTVLSHFGVALIHRAFGFHQLSHAC